MKSGQILIIVLLIVVVTLAVGLSVASRNITNLRTSTQTEQSQRAFSAAEGGVEDVLNRLSSIANYIAGTGSNPDPANCGSVSGTTVTCRVSVSSEISADVDVKAKPTYETIVDTGKITQVGLVHTQLGGYNGDVVIAWGKRGSEDGAPGAAALEITFVCNSSPCVGNSDTPTWLSTYRQNRFIYKHTVRTGENSAIPFCPVTTNPAYVCQTTVNTQGTNVLFARIRPLWRNTTISVSGTGANFPTQTYDISALATTPSGIARRVTVQRSALPTLPAAFDFAVYSEESITK